MPKVNLIKSLSMKHQLRLCYRFLSNSSILSEVQVGEGDIFDSMSNDALDIELIESLKRKIS